MTLERVKPNTIKCKLCHSTAYSPHGKAAQMCECGKCGVDTSDYYERFLGNREDFDYIDYKTGDVLPGWGRNA